MADHLPDGWTRLNHRHLVALQPARHASRRPPQRAIDHLAEYKRIGLSHVVIDFGRDDLGRMLELLDLVTKTIRPAEEKAEHATTWAMRNDSQTLEGGLTTAGRSGGNTTRDASHRGCESAAH